MYDIPRFIFKEECGKYNFEKSQITHVQVLKLQTVRVCFFEQRQFWQGHSKRLKIYGSIFDPLEILNQKF